MISCKKLKEIRAEDTGRANDRCYNCPTKIVLNEIFGISVIDGCVNEFSKYILPLIPENIKKKFNFRLCSCCRLASITFYKSTIGNKI